MGQTVTSLVALVTLVGVSLLGAAAAETSVSWNQDEGRIDVAVDADAASPLVQPTEQTVQQAEDAAHDGEGEPSEEVDGTEDVEDARIAASASPDGLHAGLQTSGSTIALTDEGLLSHPSQRQDTGDGSAGSGSGSADDGSDATVGHPTLTVRVGDGQLIDIEVTPTDPSEIVDEATGALEPHEPPAEHGKADLAAPSEQASGQQEDEQASLAWTIAPVAGVAAAAAAGHAFPVTRWLRRILGLTPVLPLFSRIPRDEVLDHEHRESIYALLETEPGLCLEEISTRLALSRSTARHHVRKLEQARMIEHEVLGRSRVHFLVGQRERAMKRHLLANGTRRRVYEALLSKARTITEVAQATGANPGSVHFHLGKLVDAGLVERAEEGKRYVVANHARGQSPTP